MCEGVGVSVCGCVIERKRERERERERVSECVIKKLILKKQLLLFFL